MTPFGASVLKPRSVAVGIVEVAKKILSVLEQHELPCQWDNQDIGKAISVRLDKKMIIWKLPYIYLRMKKPQIIAGMKVRRNVENQQTLTTFTTRSMIGNR